MSAPPDLVFRVRHPGPDLRYAIRSQVSNLPHAHLWTAGVRVPWLMCPHIDVPKRAGQFRWDHAFAVVLAILGEERLSPSVIISDDDMFLMSPLDHLPSYTGGRLADMKVSGERAQSLRDTIAILGPDHPNHELHTPTLVDRVGLRNELGKVRLPRPRMERLFWRTLAAPPPPLVPYVDVKIRNLRHSWPAGPWVSTSDASWFTIVGQRIQAAFPDPCRWER